MNATHPNVKPVPTTNDSAVVVTPEMAATMVTVQRWAIRFDAPTGPCYYGPPAFGSVTHPQNAVTFASRQAAESRIWDMEFFRGRKLAAVAIEVPVRFLPGSLAAAMHGVR